MLVNTQALVRWQLQSCVTVAIAKLRDGNMIFGGVLHTRHLVVFQLPASDVALESYENVCIDIIMYTSLIVVTIKRSVLQPYC